MVRRIGAPAALRLVGRDSLARNLFAAHARLQCKRVFLAAAAKIVVVVHAQRSNFKVIVIALISTIIYFDSVLVSSLFIIITHVIIIIIITIIDIIMHQLLQLPRTTHQSSIAAHISATSLLANLHKLFGDGGQWLR